MVGVLAFAATLLLAVLVSALAHRTVLSTAVLFLAVGFAIGKGALSLITVGPADPLVRILAVLALVSVLFTDGMRASVRDLVSAWHLPGRALLLGLPITLALTALAARFVVGLPWPDSFLVGAVLSPTDPVFAVAIVGREDVPYRLRHLLNVESGLNDGLALPVVLVLLAIVGRQEMRVGTEALQLLAGLGIGIAIPWAAAALERSRFFSASAAYEPLGAFAVGLLVFSAAALTGMNEFLAAFAGGVTVATASPAMRTAFHRFGDLVTELLKLAALMVFGIAVHPSLFADVGVRGYAFAVVALVLARPIAIGLAFLGARVPAREWLAAAWFGPKGFASVVYGLLILQSGVPGAGRMFDLVAIVIIVSIVAHSSTDVVVARWFRGTEAPPA